MKRLLDFFVSPRVAVWCLACLMVLTFFGTLYQVDHGLHAAKARYFDSYFVLIGGFVPFPGTQLVLALLTLNLFVYTIQVLLMPRFMPGIVMIHAGLLMLLVGGAITHHFAEESNLALHEGQGANVSTSYGDWEIALLGPVDSATGAREVLATTISNRKAGEVITIDPLGLRIDIKDFHINARAFQQQGAETEWLSSANISRIEATKPAKEPGENVAAAHLSVTPADGDPFQVLLFGEDVSPKGITAKGATWDLALRRVRYPLPMKVTLMDFKRDMHPGTEMAKSYSSTVLVEADGLTREATISMNKPLRHRGYTLFQASFVEDQGGQTSVFAVTRNYGRLLPYISTGIVVLGMIVHFTLMLIRRAGALRKEARS